MQKKSLKLWIILLVLPWVALVVSIIINLIGTVASRGQTYSSVRLVTNVISLLLGVVAVFGMMLLPLWGIMLGLAIDHNHKLDNPVATPPATPPQEPPKS